MRYVALLRGIHPMNPNMRNEKLRSLFEELGFQNVSTVINSGNVIFDSRSKNQSAMEAKIEKALQQKLHFSSTTFIRSQQELTQLLANNPFEKRKKSKGDYHIFTFLKHNTSLPFSLPLKTKTATLLQFNTQTLASVVHREQAKTTDFMRFLEKECGKDITTRTWQTIERIVKKMETL